MSCVMHAFAPTVLAPGEQNCSRSQCWESTEVAREDVGNIEGLVPSRGEVRQTLPHC